MADRDYDRRFDERDRQSSYRDRDVDRNWTDRDTRDRGGMARGADQMRTWFGDDDARRRREGDDPRDRDTQGRDERAWSDERGYSSSRERGGEREPRGDGGWSNREYGNREPRSSEYGSRYASPPGWTTVNYGGAGTNSGGYAREDWGPRSGLASGSGRGGFSGRGPRSYQRSDERIREDVNERLTDDPRIDASDIEVDVSGGEVTLRGRVDERRTRRLAEECIENVPGVRDVRNELRAEHREHDGGIGHQGNPMQRDDRTTLNLSDAERTQRKKP